MSDGWVKLHRKSMKWGWYKKPHMFHLFSHLIMSANHEDGEWEGMPVLRGQLITGRKSLSSATGISQQTIRTCLARLTKTGEINQAINQAHTVITINNYDEYQSCEEKSTSQSTSDQPRVNQGSTTNKKLRIKEVKKEYGEFSNVLLTDQEHDKLSERFNGSLSQRINRLSSYIASKGVKYKSHYATILSWAQKDEEKTNGSEWQ